MSAKPDRFGRTSWEQLQAHHKQAIAAIRSWQKAFAQTYPIGTRITWTHGSYHPQAGVVVSNAPAFYELDTDLMLAAKNDVTGKIVRVRIHQIHGATPQSRSGSDE